MKSVQAGHSDPTFASDDMFGGGFDPSF